MGRYDSADPGASDLERLSQQYRSGASGGERGKLKESRGTRAVPFGDPVRRSYAAETPVDQRKSMSLTDDDKKWINESIATSETRLMAAIERVETSLLTEFHKWASPLEMRVRSHSTNPRIGP